ncbi:MAG TPA: ATP-binding protein [Patescibacteria group bacterium]|nr:ATP-binding protein [Patescibacteria group bacterium]
MFHHARLKLTLWYIFIAVVITFLFSLLAYNGFRFEVERGLQRQRVYIQQNFLTPNGSTITLRQIDPTLQEEIRERLVLRIIYIDLAVIIVAAVGGYFLAGRTLKPIQTMVDEQNRFVADASHELRTPLTALRAEMETSLLENNLAAPDAKKLIKSNLEEVVRLQRLSDSLLELATYNHTASHKINDVSLLQIMEEALKKVSPLAKKKNITIQNNARDASINGDSHRLSELFVILLDNAIKYSPAKSEVKIMSKKNDGQIEISVQDQGIGIAPEDLPFIFDRFYRSDKSRSKSTTAGYGLGLAIAKQIAKEHKGSITVKSSLDKGSTFTVSLGLK